MFRPAPSPVGSSARPNQTVRQVRTLSSGGRPPPHSRRVRSPHQLHRSGLGVIVPRPPLPGFSLRARRIRRRLDVVPAWSQGGTSLLEVSRANNKVGYSFIAFGKCATISSEGRQLSASHECSVTETRLGRSAATEFRCLYRKESQDCHPS